MIPGAPRGKQVAKVTRFGAFTPAKTRQEMEDVRQIARRAMAGREPFPGPVSLKLAAYMPVPTSWSQRKRTEALAGRLFPTVKPDGSNIQKLVEDACLPPHLTQAQKRQFTDKMLRTVIRDDSQIVRWQGWKIYAADPRIVVEISEIDLPALM